MLAHIAGVAALGVQQGRGEAAVWLLVLLCWIPASANAQPADASLDVRLLWSVYETEAPVLRTTFRAADATAYPAFVLAPTAAWSAALIEPDLRAEAWHLSLAGACAVASFSVIKRLVRRTRPYRVYDELVPRYGELDAELLQRDSYSFPSGHATLAFALATSTALSYPRWYVVAPTLGWAGAVATSRVWLGVHYPSDVLVGAVLGSGLGLGVYLLRDALTPEVLEDDQNSPPMLMLRIGL